MKKLSLVFVVGLALLLMGCSLKQEFSLAEVKSFCDPYPVESYDSSSGIVLCALDDPILEKEPFQGQSLPPVATATPAPIQEQAKVQVVVNNLQNPELHHGDSHAPEEGYGSFDVGVKDGQIGLVFGYHILWPKGTMDAGGDGCDLVILTPGWYEDLQMIDARYEVYDVPSSDYLGWVKVLGEQRADEQSKNYGCPAWEFEDIPQWESSIQSPP